MDTIRNPVPFSGPEMEDAKKIYNTTCWTCHGMDGKGAGPASVAINPKPADHTSQAVQSESDGALFWKISVGKGNMQPYRTLLTVKQRWALVNYIRTFSNTGSKSKLSQAQE
ncbi:MAG: cytochrome c [Bacteroidetes bacterium]|nr:cytochrome c [Bacteroidota bacterium]